MSNKLKLQALREEFQRMGYLPNQIEEVEVSEGNGSIENRINQLEMEKSYWGS